MLTTNKKPMGVADPKCKVFDFPLQILEKLHPRVGDFAFPLQILTKLHDPPNFGKESQIIA
ncbi:hypothetical protein TorRG33x02_352020 [Trema orientale]|uniref:Uncharacterized protein n=1 Tax=Trema orientale TaxID=63057 RepID=A0A2P5AF21_TREOI|nr:hypothetical protein TorRG33x02_352020 [Trema orientale]